MDPTLGDVQNLAKTGDKIHLEKNQKNKTIGTSPRQTILIDEYEEHPTKEYESIAKTIASMIKNSHPRFTTGIYGEWGTGKTTLMRSIEKSL
ncbi:MAG: KAP family NTPase, partial [Nitrosopumilus sp.]|nr:KAP family NTPase [Nitrosopumilus sp.]